MSVVHVKLSDTSRVVVLRQEHSVLRLLQERRTQHGGWCTVVSQYEVHA